MHKLLLFLKRKPGLSLAQFQDYYEGHHVPLIMRSMAGVERYQRRYLDHPSGVAELPFDVITELWFKDRATLDYVQAMLARDDLAAEIIADELQFMDRSQSRAVAVAECETLLD